MLKEDEIRTLNHRIKQGDIEAFHTLYTECFEQLCTYACRFVYDQEEAQDIVQDSFYALWTNLRFYNPDYSVLTYLTQIVKNNCYNYLNSLRIHDEHRDKIIEALLFSDLHDSEPEEDIRRRLHEVLERTARARACHLAGPCAGEKETENHRRRNGHRRIHRQDPPETRHAGAPHPPQLHFDWDVKPVQSPQSPTAPSQTLQPLPNPPPKGGLIDLMLLFGDIGSRKPVGMLMNRCIGLWKPVGMLVYRCIGLRKPVGILVYRCIGSRKPVGILVYRRIGSRKPVGILVYRCIGSRKPIGMFMNRCISRRKPFGEPSLTPCTISPPSGEGLGGAARFGRGCRG